MIVIAIVMYCALHHSPILVLHSKDRKLFDTVPFSLRILAEFNRNLVDKQSTNLNNLEETTAQRFTVK